MKPPISAAETLALRAPEIEDVKTHLPMLLKEMALNGWVSVYRQRPSVPIGVWGGLFLGVFVTTISIEVGALFVVFSLILMWSATKERTYIELTSLGESKLQQKLSPNSPLLLRALKTVWMAIPENESSCTAQAWRTYLREQYLDNQGFHQKFLLTGLRKSGWLTGPDYAPQRTSEGDILLDGIEKKLSEHSRLPDLVRQRSPEAARAAFTLGGLVLLMPGLEGCFHELRQIILHNPYDLREDVAPVSSDGSGPTGSFGDSYQREDERDDLDWGDNSDYLDGDFDMGGESSESGCGLESGGDSGDGCGGDGCGGGCGGCGGGD